MYGIRKMWHTTRRGGWQVGRDQAARLTRQAGLSGTRRGRRPITTRPDLVRRGFRASRPDQLRVADITCVRTSCGFVHTAPVTDVLSHKTVGWPTRSTLSTQAPPPEALEQAIATARDRLDGLVHHADHGSRHTSITYSE